MVDMIFLIGFRAVGKTTVGRSLALQLGYEFLDTDTLISERYSLPVREIVGRYGWDAFRRSEAEVLQAAAQGGPRVVATGGGAILHQQIWKTIKKTRALVVWLNADLASLTERLNRDRHSAELRPSLTGGDVNAEIAGILVERNPLYRQTADLELNTTDLTIPEIVAKICQTYREKKSRSRQ
jgi:shikimate kinase